MSTKYKKQEDVPTEALAKRLDELSNAVVQRMNNNERAFLDEFTCRIPCELDRDADVVLQESSRRMTDLQSKLEAAEARVGNQPQLTVKLMSFPESNGKRNWTAMIVRTEKWDGLVGSCGGVTVDYGEYWNRVAYEAERAKFLLGERDDEPCILDYGDDIKTPDEWKGEVRGGRPVKTKQEKG